MIKKQIVAIICLSFLIAPVFAAQVAIVSTDTRQEGWAKETLNNSDLQTNIDGKETADAAIVKSDEAETLSAAWDLGTPSAGVGTNLTGIPAATGLIGGNWTVFYVNGSGVIFELALGADGEYLMSNGAGVAPSFETPAGSGDALVANPLSQFAATTSLQLLGVMSDETGTGSAVFATSPTFVTPVLGAATATSIDITKTSGVAGLVSIKESTTTSELYFGIMGPSDITAAESYSVQIPDAQPAGSFLVVATPAGTGDPNGNKVGAGTWASDPRLLSMAVANLADPTTPSVLTAVETTNTIVSNYKATGADHEFEMPAAHIRGNIIFPIGDEFQVDISPTSGGNFYLNGVAMATDEHIQNTADTLGEQIVGFCSNINGTLTWMFESKYTNFVEETP